MLFFVKGNAVPNATSYTLYRKNNDEYTPIATQAIGKLTDFEAGKLTSNGRGVDTDSTWVHSGFIRIDKLENLEGIKQCVYLDTNSNYDQPVVGYYKKYDDHLSLIEYLTWNDLQNIHGCEAEDFKTTAEFNGAQYVVFCSYAGGTNPFWVNVTKDIFFALDECTSQLPAGQTHQLVVKAIASADGVDTDGDGTVDIIYADSDYCFGADGNPLSYTV